MTLSWGIAATGRIARTVGAVVVEHPGMRVAAVGSRDAARAAALAGELGAPAWFGSYEQLVRDPSVQAVYVATPHAQHADVVLTALAAGKAVLCEKPMTHDLAETERLVEAAAQHGTFLMEGMWTRFNPLVQQLHALVAEGVLGELRSFTASIGFAAPEEPTSRLWAPALGGGALLDVGVYTVDLARALLGEPVDVQARGSRAGTGVDAESTVLLSFASGAHATLHHSLVSAMPTTALLVGSRGWVELGPSFYAPTRMVVQLGGAPAQVHELADRRAGFFGELDEVARCLRSGRLQSDVAPLAETVATMRVLDAARRSLEA